MDYIYDIVLNFQERYYDFYEWLPKDKIINIKRIPIYKITTKDYVNIKNNYVLIDKSTLKKQGKMFLLTNGIEVMGVLIDDDGKVVKISSLLFDEADEILEDIDNIKLVNIRYKALKPRNIAYLSRDCVDKQNYVNKYLNSLDLVMDEYLIKYLYYDIFNIDEKDIHKIYNELSELAKKDVNKLYNGIKKIDLELKR